jgi:hypothetical protein
MRTGERCHWVARDLCSACVPNFESWVDEQIVWYAAQLDLLKRLPAELAIRCLICNGESPQPELCGCGGTITVAVAIANHESELEILSK